MVNYLRILPLLPVAAAWPGVAELNVQLQGKRQSYPAVPAPKFKSGRQNTGAQGPAVGFNAEDQYVDVSPGSGHEFIAPGPEDLRGQCPGLNAAANHGFLPHNGIPNIVQTIEGLGAAYNMAVDLSTTLAVISVAIAGDYLTQSWSIGSSYTSTLGLLGQPKGIVGTHSRYEGDASIVRGDAYLHNGSVSVFEMHKWEHLYSLGEEFDHDMAAAQNAYTTMYSVQNNPYYFSGPFSGLVAPDAHNFVINMMSNHSAENPGGTLTRETLKSFFAVEGEPGSFTHHPGMERIPENWYRRPTLNAFTVAGTNLDTVVNTLMYPGIVRFGGNTGTVNSFSGIDEGDLTSGLFNAESLLDGNNLACFFLQATQEGLADQLGPLEGVVGDLMSFLDQHLSPILDQYSCPKLSNFNNELFSKYPGASYRAEEQ